MLAALLRNSYLQQSTCLRKSAHWGKSTWSSGGSLVDGFCGQFARKTSRQLVSIKGPKLEALGVETLQWPEMWTQNGSYENIEKNLALLADWGMDPAGQRRVALTTPVVVEHPQEKIKRTLTWLVDELGCTKKEVVKIVAAHPRVFQCSVQETLNPFLGMFVDGGYTAHQVKQMILRNPQVLGRNKKLDALVECLSSMLGLSPTMDTLKLVLSCPKLLGYSIERTIKPNLNRLLNLEISPPNVEKIVIRAPELLLCDFDIGIASKLTWLQDELKLESHKSLAMMIARPRVFDCNLTLWIANRDTLLSFGLSLERVAELIAKAPFLLSMRPAYLREKFEFAHRVLRKGHDEILQCPDYFTHSFGDRILLRAAFLDCRGDDMSKWTLSSLVKLSYKGFEELFSPGEFESFSQEWGKLDKNGKLQILNPKLRFD